MALLGIKYGQFLGSTQDTLIQLHQSNSISEYNTR